MAATSTTLKEQLEETCVTIVLALFVPRFTLVNNLPRYVWPVWADLYKYEHKAKLSRWWRKMAIDPNYRLKLHQRLSKGQEHARRRPSGVLNELCAHDNHQYASLPQRHIRLLHIQSGSKCEPIRCSLTTHSIDEVPDFEALSYTWGNPTRLRNILCDEKSIQIGFNLWEAFQQLRHPNRSRTMWIDALCINQTDLTERSEQVQLMDSIYHRARSVIVWLGAASQSSPAAFRLIREIHAIAVATHLEDLDKPLLVTNIEELGLPEKYSADWTALDSIFWRAWFKRVWIVQEVAVAKSAVVTCGADSTSWDVFAKVADFITRRQLNTLRDVNVLNILPLSGMRNSYRDNAEISLLTLLACFRQSLATNPIDKVYALLNLTSDVDILPDYTLSTVDAFCRVCTTYLQRSLDILSLIGDTSWNQLMGLPSWVPDWSSILRESPFLSNGYGLALHTGGNTFPKVMISEDGKTVPVHGILIDRVQVTGNVLIMGDGAAFRLAPFRSRGAELVEEIHHLIFALVLRSWERIILGLKRYPTGEDIRTVLCKTLIANTNLGAQTSSEQPDLERVYSLFRKRYAMPLGLRPEIGMAQYDVEYTQLYCRALMNAAYGRKVIVSQHGYIGLCPYSTRRSDCIVAFNGGKTAYILRETHRNGTMNFTYVGEAYIHGFMDGEAFQDTSNTSAKVFTIV